jgi:hypothetical protein
MTPMAPQHLSPAIAAALARAQQPRKDMAVHAAELAIEPRLQILRRTKSLRSFAFAEMDQASSATM